MCQCLQCPFGDCTPDGSGRWECSVAPANGCPAVASTGQPCPDEGLSCTYGTLCSPTTALRICTGGVWVDAPQACEG